MKKLNAFFVHKSAFAILLAVLLLQATNSIAQVDTLKAQTDTIAQKTDTLVRENLAQAADTTPVSKKNIKANLATMDATAPSVYKINPLSTALIGVAATAANMIAINNILHNKPDLTEAEIQAANRNILNRFDRWALELDPSKRDHFYSLSDKGLTITLAASAATFLFNKKTRKDWLRLGLMFYQTQFLTFAFYDFSFFGPLFQNRLRPIVYYDYFPIEQRKGGNQKNSFYSGHVANATAATFFAVKVYCDYHPEIGNKKILLYAAASVPPLVTGWLRMKALAHFPSDIMAGYLIGGVFGIVIPELHRIKTRNLQVNTFYNGQSGGLRFTYALGRKSAPAPSHATMAK
ncbi:phosphatase PAP2 family protein [Flavisolibacter nicotianae]|uniref:phosphatase PAP2 family protein n=1 Tax=Flavisolibacter nicotianae TaxID=2364882 RepID=UPI0013C4FF60|nr:phosphatase PAP2 family protein [Flavisolibacter nicotianae]